MPPTVFYSVIPEIIPKRRLEFDFVNASRANLFILKADKVILASAEQANVLVFFKYNTVPFNIDFNRVRIVYVKLGTDFLRDYNASKLVNVTNYTGRFHFSFHLSRGVGLCKRVAMLLPKISLFGKIRLTITYCITLARKSQ